MNEDKYRLLLIGDFTYFLNGRYFINTAIIIWGSLALCLQLFHYCLYYTKESPSYSKPFEKISGLVSPKSIGLINREDINQLLKKSKLMFEISRFLTIGMSFVTFWTSRIALIMNSSFSLYLIEIFYLY